MSTTTTNLGLTKPDLTDARTPAPFNTNFDTLDTYFGGSGSLKAVGASGNGTNNGGRWVGTTASGPPAAGTYVQGDWVVTQNGGVWICTAAGSPGTWIKTGGFKFTTQTASAYSAVANDFVLSNAGGLDQTINLPTMVNAPAGTVIVVKIIATSSFTRVLITPSSSILVDGKTQWILVGHLAQVTLVSDGTGWQAQQTYASAGVNGDTSGYGYLGLSDGGAPSTTYNGGSGIHLYSSGGRGKIRDGVGNVWNLDSSQLFRSTAATANTTVTLATISNLTLTLNAGTYAFEANGTYTCAATTTGMQLAVAFSGTSTAVNYGAMIATAAATSANGSAAALNTKIGSASVGPSSPTTMPFQLTGTIVVTVAGTFSIQYASGVAASGVTPQIGSYLRVTRIA